MKKISPKFLEWMKKELPEMDIRINQGGEIEFENETNYVAFETDDLGCEAYEAAAFYTDIYNAMYQYATMYGENDIYYHKKGGIIWTLTSRTAQKRPSSIALYSFDAKTGKKTLNYEYDPLFFPFHKKKKLKLWPFRKKSKS